MQYLKMLPYQVREAIEKNTPVVLPLGVIEYHAEHLPLGVDMFVAQNIIDRVEARRPELVVLPPFYYGCASNAVAKAEGHGTLNVDSEKIIPIAEEIFSSLLKVGFRNIHAFVAHQTEEFYQGMPTDLAFRFAARHSIMEHLEKAAGEGWWGTEKYSAYYSGSNNPFAWIQVHPVRFKEETARRFKGDHSGLLETSETLAMYPELVEMDRIDGSLWYARPAKDATAEYGEAALSASADDMEELLFGE